MPTPRIGGVAVVTSTVLLSAVIPDVENHDIWLLILSLWPVFLVGLAEDLGFSVSPKNRLIAAALSSLVALLLFRLWIPRFDVPFLDDIIIFAPIAIALTLFGGSGICNAFNLVDGVNGLSGSIAIVVATSLAIIAAINGLTEISTWCMALIGALLGFLVFNFPLGKIFMGDAGAYSVGHILAWLAILLLNFIPELTPWSLVLIFFWPIADTILAIFRRRRAGRRADQPDRLHFHQLVMRALEIDLLGRNMRHISNPLSTILMLPMFTVPSILGVLLWRNPLAAFFSCLLLATLFVLTYQTGLRFAGRLRLPLRRKPHVRWAHKKEKNLEEALNGGRSDIGGG